MDKSIVFPENVKQIISRIESAGGSAYAVGGCIRDFFIGREPNDWDITTSLTPDRIISLFDTDGFYVLDSAGVRHGTVMVKCGDGVYEITTYRCDGEYSDHRRPESVSFSDRVEDDLARRDFTVNAIAARPNEDGLEVVDPFGGREDIKNKLLRAVGEPDRRFGEDALRILRLIRFSSELGFAADPDTAESALSLVDTLSFVSAERNTAEVWRTLSGKHFAGLSGELLSVFSSLFPAGVTESAFAAASKSADPFVRLALIFRKSEDADSFFRNMRFPTKTRAVLMRLLEIKSAPDSVASTCRLIDGFGDMTDIAAEYIRLRFDEDISSFINKVRSEMIPYKVTMLAMGGGDVSAAGIPQKYIGQVLSELLSDVHEGRSVNTADSLSLRLQEIKKQFQPK